MISNGIQTVPIISRCPTVLWKNYLHAEKGNALKNVCDIFDLTNLIKNPTCFCKDANPSFVDVILTNKPTSCGKNM